MRLAAALCLFLASQDGEPASDREPTATAVASALSASDPIDAVSRAIERERGNSDRRALLAQLYAIRGDIWLHRRNAPQPALADFEEALRLNPENYSAQIGRAESHRQLNLIPIGTEQTWPVDTGFQQQMPWSPESAWSMAVSAWFFMLLCNVAIGWPQKKEAHASLGLLLLVCACLALIAALPAVVLASFAARGAVLVDQFQVAAGSLIFSFICIVPYLKPPVRLRGTKEKLPLVTDERFLARVARLSEKMRLPMPLVRLWPSISGSQQALAFVGTLHAPQLVVTDGILQRLEADECDAIVAHELGHIANGSIWLLAAVVPVSCAVMTAAASVLPFSLTIPFGIAFLVGLRRLVSRPAEFDCDYRAAQAIGFRATISALAKIHAVNPVPNSGLLSLLVFATATHPPRDARLAALYAAAPGDDRPEAAPNAAMIQKYRRAALGTLAIWLLVLSGTLLAAVWGRYDAWLAIPLWTVGLGPMALLILAVRKRVSRARRRMGQRWSIVYLVAIGAVIGVSVPIVLVALHESNTFEDGTRISTQMVPIVSAVIGCGACVWLMLTHTKRELMRKVAIAMQVHDFHRALDLCAAAPKIVRRAHMLRYQQAIAQAVCGNRLAAIAALEQLWSDKPRFPLTALALGELLLDSNQSQRAVEVATNVGRRLPHDPAVPILEARALRRLGRIDAAQEACDRALAIEPDDGCINAVAAALALDRGHTERAQALIARALEFAPGEAYLLVVCAEIVLQSEFAEQARKAVVQAAQAVRTNPLVFMQQEITRLEAALIERFEPVATENIFID